MPYIIKKIVQGKTMVEALKGERGDIKSCEECDYEEVDVEVEIGGFAPRVENKKK